MATKGEQTREKILVEARLVFKRKGFGATTINDLLAAAGITKGNLYFHFADKETLGLEVLKREQQSFYHFLDQAFEVESPIEGLENLFHSALDKNRQQGFVGGCLFGNTALEASDTSPIYATVVQEVFTEWISRVAQVITAGQVAEQIRTDVSPEALAELVVATIEGGIMQARLQKDEKPLQRSLDALETVLGIQKETKSRK
ncbi:MAG: TetR family transcriptional regulator C-terminal domain-containing protein [Desulfuromusa sp.]